MNREELYHEMMKVVFVKSDEKKDYREKCERTVKSVWKAT